MALERWKRLNSARVRELLAHPFDALLAVDGDVGRRPVLIESDDSTCLTTDDPGVKGHRYARGVATPALNRLHVIVHPFVGCSWVARSSGR
ncbi:hypothetical protein C476_15895 [Natrinema limicola JCM 13563]|uniref:Uncharacterized protein n=1 Tax=Natrinema limicola JCM 13563 TaxID=1230457 RepID=M0C546_9EURY|nr:hypothetical protein C476_15895 [Natrinema limicola JCM 13563]